MTHRTRTTDGVNSPCLVARRRLSSGTCLLCIQYRYSWRLTPRWASAISRDLTPAKPPVPQWLPSRSWISTRPGPRHHLIVLPKAGGSRTSGRRKVPCHQRNATKNTAPAATISSAVARSGRHRSTGDRCDAVCNARAARERSSQPVPALSYDSPRRQLGSVKPLNATGSARPRNVDHAPIAPAVTATAHR